MSRQEILNMLQRQATYDSGAGGALIGGARRGRKKTAKKVRMSAKSKSAKSRRSRSVAALTRKMAAAGLLGGGMMGYGAMGGVSLQDPLYAAQRKQLLKQLKEYGAIASADYGAPYSPLVEGMDEMDNDELASYITELQRVAALRSKVLTDWRQSHQTAAQIAKSGALFKEFLEGKPLSGLSQRKFAETKKLAALAQLPRSYLLEAKYAE
jgi:hypothetical protein